LGKHEHVERKLAAILAADIVGYSRLMGVDEIGTLRALKAVRKDVVDTAIAAYGGRIVKTTGDGLLVDFPSVVDAVACAVTIQRKMIERNRDISEEKRIVFRVGINIGDIIIDGKDIFGDGVNIAARLESICDPGGLCISDIARDQVRDKLPLTFTDCGEQQVKNIARPVRVFALAPQAIAAAPELSPGRVAPARARSLAILAGALALAGESPAGGLRGDAYDAAAPQGVDRSQQIQRRDACAPGAVLEHAAAAQLRIDDQRESRRHRQDLLAQGPRRRIHATEPHQAALAAQIMGPARNRLGPGALQCQCPHRTRVEFGAQNRQPAIILQSLVFEVARMREQYRPVGLQPITQHRSGIAIDPQRCHDASPSTPLSTRSERKSSEAEMTSRWQRSDIRVTARP